MAAGKIFHWKHGWIPISAQAKQSVADRESAKRDRLAASRAKNSDRDNAKEARLRERDNEKRGAVSAERMISKYKGSDSAGTPPQTKINDRIADDRPFTYSPGTNEVSPYRKTAPPDLVPGTETPVGFSSGRLGQTEIPRQEVDSIVVGLINTFTTQLQSGAKIGGKPSDKGYVIGLTK